jgi:hypothetical protein
MNAYNKYLMDTLQKAGPKVQIDLQIYLDG